MTFAALSRIRLAVLCTLLFIVNAAAQQGAQTGGNTGGGSGRSNSTLRSFSANDAQFLSAAPFISGSVVMSDGTPLPAGVVIERVCRGQTNREAYVDVNGNFTFQIGAGNILPDASDSGLLPSSNPAGGMAWLTAGSAARMTAAYADCELRAQLGGYRSSSVSLDLGRFTGQMDVGTIVLHPTAQARGTTISVTELQAPKNARKSLEKAEEAFKRNDWKLAQEHLQEALSDYPRFAPAWLRLGQIFVMTCRNDDAREAFSKAIAADEDFVPPFIELARLAAQDQSWQEVADLSEHASQLDPLDFPAAFYLNGLADLNLGRLDIAESSVQKAQRIDNQNRMPQTHLLLASILHRKKDHAAEMAQLKDYLRIAPHAADAERIRYQLEVMGMTGHR